MIQTDYGKSMLSYMHSFEEYNLWTNGHIQNFDGSIFFFVFFLCICGLGDTNTKKKLKKVRCFTGSGLFLIQMGLFTLYSATASVEQIKNVDIWGQFKMIFFFKWKKVCPLYACILEPQTNSYTQTSAQFRN